MAQEQMMYEEAIIEATFALAAEKGWRSVRLMDIAERADQPLSAVHRTFSSRADLIAAFNRRIDAQVIEESRRDLDPQRDSVRDRLFDVLMLRYDAMTPYKAGIRAIGRDMIWDGELLLITPPALIRSMGWMLEAASLPSQGPLGHLRAQGLAAVYLTVVRTWFEDDSEDQAKTMAALDQALRRAEEAANTVLPPLERLFEPGLRTEQAQAQAQAHPEGKEAQAGAPGWQDSAEGPSSTPS